MAEAREVMAGANTPQACTGQAEMVPVATRASRSRTLRALKHRTWNTSKRRAEREEARCRKISSGVRRRGRLSVARVGGGPAPRRPGSGRTGRASCRAAWRGARGVFRHQGLEAAHGVQQRFDLGSRSRAEGERHHLSVREGARAHTLQALTGVLREDEDGSGGMRGGRCSVSVYGARETRRGS